MKINWERTFQFLLPELNAMPMDFFFCFGTMLTVMRDGKFGKHDDIDIGLFFDDYDYRYIKNLCQNRGFFVDHTINCDLTGKPLFISMKPSDDVKSAIGDVHIDFFAWYKHEGFYWHTYDVGMDRPKKGTPRKYIFKGIPCWMFDDGWVNRDNIADSRGHAKIPLKYGSIMDVWYPPTPQHPPGWIDPCPSYGVSKTKWEIEMKSMKSFINKDYKKIKWSQQ